MRLGAVIAVIAGFACATASAVDISGAYPCINACTEAGGNQEACVDQCVTLVLTSFDSDGDGIPNIFEKLFGTNPNKVDALQDPDFDGLVNLEEFFRRSDPFDPFDPIPTFFVAPDGVNLPERGSREAPWRDISYAIEVLEPSAEMPVNIVLKTGLYQEDLVLKPGIRLRSALFNRAIINGTIIGADACALQSINLTARRLGDVLLTMNDVRMAVLDVRFNGGMFRTGQGIWSGGQAAFLSVIDGCEFTSMQVGIEAAGAIPLIRRSHFDNLAQAGVLIRASSESFISHTLGSAEDPGSGWNVFGANMDVKAVVNERSDTVPMENNDWATDDPFSSDNRVEGPSDIEPFLASGSAVLAGAVYCSVWETGNNQAPVIDATVTLVPSVYAPVTENENGVYVFAAVPPGSYAATATHPTLGTATISVQVQGGDVVTVNLPLGEDPIPTGTGCNCNNKSGETPLQAGDGLVGAVFLAALISAQRAKRKN